ncbi:MAG: 4Fe-4S cluster-binding domain-containing protein [Victivallales bacterium]|nr:4Fe-4S cluster-binding domain-containing protein [Victivallales bacterium]
MGQVFDIQRFSTHDGPGIRTTVFFKGCPLRCFWCQNPEGLTSERQLQFTATRCVLCAECAKICSAGVHVLAGPSAKSPRRPEILWELAVRGLEKRP